MSSNKGSVIGIRSFTEKGRSAFRELISNQQDRIPVQEDAALKSPYIDIKTFEDLALSRSELSVKVEHTKPISSKANLGSTKFTMAKYLDDKLPDESFEQVYDDHGMWEWLACLWISNFVVKRRDKKFQSGWKPPFNHKWLQIEDAGFFKTRHCIKDYSYYYRQYKTDSSEDHLASVLLSGNINEFGEIANQFFIPEIPVINKNLLKYLNEFFFQGLDDEGNPSVRTGISGTSGKDKKTGKDKYPYRAARIKAFSLLTARSYDLSLTPYKDYRKIMQAKLKIPSLNPVS